MTGVFVASHSHVGFPCLQFYGRLQYARMSNAQMKATHESNSYNGPPISLHDYADIAQYWYRILCDLQLHACSIRYQIKGFAVSLSWLWAIIASKPYILGATAPTAPGPHPVPPPMHMTVTMQWTLVKKFAPHWYEQSIWHRYFTNSVASKSPIFC